MSALASVVMECHDGRIVVAELGQSRRRITAYGKGSSDAPLGSCETTYPLDLIRSILDAKGAAWACDEISRDQDPESIQKFFEDDFLPYVDSADFEGKRILDFGCGSGSSTMVMARMFPRSQIVGVELSSEYLEIAERRRLFYGHEHVRFVQSPSGTSLPRDLGSFDFVVMSAVFEHLLPAERLILMPQLWAHLRSGGCLLLNQTPHRYFPFESHTTGLPLINYLPDRVAHAMARRFSPRGLTEESWDSLLRKGIRGATEREILASLGKTTAAAPALLSPRKPLYRDRVDVWYAALSPRHRSLKAACRELLRLGERLLGTTFVVNLALAIGKETNERRDVSCPAR